MNFVRFVVTLVIAGVVGILGYQAGVAQGLAQAGGTVATAPYYVAPFGFGFGFFGLLFTVLLLFLLFGLGRALFWGGRWGGYGHPGRPGPWGDRERMLEDWHRRAHGEPTTETARPAQPPDRA